MNLSGLYRDTGPIAHLRGERCFIHSVENETALCRFDNEELEEGRGGWHPIPVADLQIAEGDDGLDEPEEPEEPAHVLFVSVYFASKTFGGPEEGGWWYEFGELVTERDFYLSLDVSRLGEVAICPAVFMDEEQAENYRQALQVLLDDTVNKDLPPLDSVLSQGRYKAHLSDVGYLPTHYPQQKPRYE